MQYPYQSRKRLIIDQGCNYYPLLDIRCGQCKRGAIACMSVFWGCCNPGESVELFQRLNSVIHQAQLPRRKVSNVKSMADIEGIAFAPTSFASLRVKSLLDIGGGALVICTFFISFPASFHTKWTIIIAITKVMPNARKLYQTTNPIVCLW